MVERKWYEPLERFYDTHDCDLIRKAQVLDWGEISEDMIEEAHSEEAGLEISLIRSTKYHNEEFAAGLL